MRPVLALLAVCVAGCAANDLDPSPQTGAQASELTLGAVGAASASTTSITWVPGGKDCGGTPCDGNNIWPLEGRITSLQILLRGGPDRAEHRIQTFLAFVVWNRTTVGRIYRVDFGAAGADFRAVSSNIIAGRTSSLPDTSAGSSGTGLGSPAPAPHPNVEGPLEFTDTYLKSVAAVAGDIDDATRRFLATPEQ